MITSMEAYPFPSNPSAGNCFRPQQSRSQRSAWWRLRQKLRLLSWTDFFITADLTARWRRHVVRYYSHTPLQLIVTGRYGPTMLVLSVMFAAEINIFFSPSDIVTDVRHTLARGQNAASGTVDYSNYRLRLATGLALIASIVVTFSAILANYTAMGVFSTVSSENAAIVYRSDVGLYAAQLPAVLTVLSFHLFVVCMGKHTF